MIVYCITERWSDNWFYEYKRTYGLASMRYRYRIKNDWWSSITYVQGGYNFHVAVLQM